MKNTGDGRRVQKMEKEVQQIVASYLISGYRGSVPALITVTHVRMPADLRTAKVYISILPSSSDEPLSEAALQKICMKELQENAPEVQNFIGQKLKSRYCPKLTFYADDSTDHVQKVEKILQDLEKERKSE